MKSEEEFKKIVDEAKTGEKNFRYFLICGVVLFLLSVELNAKLLFYHIEIIQILTMMEELDSLMMPSRTKIHLEQYGNIVGFSIFEIE